jgi:hypothetical protein
MSDNLSRRPKTFWVFGLWYYGVTMKKQVFYVHGGDSYSKYEDFMQSLRTATVRNLPGSERVPFGLRH